MRVLVWDTEIMVSPDDCIGGWEGARRGDCGISCVAIHDSQSGRLHIYDEFDLEECIDHLNEADLLVGFNTIEFDTPALQGATGRGINVDQYDILHEVWKSLGRRTKGYKLTNICERLELGTKNNDGVGAVQLYRDHRYGRLFDYCMNDVHLTRQLMNFITVHGYILDPDGNHLHLPPIGVEV